MTDWAYARVSTKDQNPQPQIDAFRKLGIESGNTVIEYASGAKTDRPQLEHLLDELSEGDSLTVWKLDRLGRSLSHLVKVITELGEKGVQFRSVSEAGIDTTTAQGRLLFQIMGSMAEFERSLVTERTRAGLHAAKARGRTGGRPTSITSAQAETVLFLISQGETQAGAARRTGLSKSAVNRLVNGRIKTATLPPSPSLLQLEE